MGHFPLTDQFSALDALYTQMIEKGTLIVESIKMSYRKSTDSYVHRIVCAHKGSLIQRTDVLRAWSAINSNDEFHDFLKRNNLRAENDIYTDSYNKIQGLTITLFA